MSASITLSLTILVWKRGSANRSPFDRYQIQKPSAMKAAHEIVKKDTMIGDFHEYAVDPACCSAKTSSTVESRQREQPIKSRRLNLIRPAVLVLGHKRAIRPMMKTPQGTLKRNTHLQVACVVMTPPRVGPLRHCQNLRCTQSYEDIMLTTRQRRLVPCLLQRSRREIEQVVLSQGGS